MRALATVVCVLCGCDNKFEMRGALSHRGGAPVVGATVALVCAGIDQRSAITDEDGRYRRAYVGAFGDHCHLEVRTVAGHVRRFALADHCTDRNVSNNCTTIVLNVSDVDDKGASP